jgi:hypothetical protein
MEGNAMKKTKGKLLYMVIGIFGAAAAVIPIGIYHLVETAGTHGMHAMPMTMACERACFAELFVGAAIAAIAIASMFVKNAKLNAAGSALLLTGGVAAIALPSVIGLCESETMACRYITAPTLTVLGAIIIILSLIRLVSDVMAIREADAAA